ncbi:unnamed protein product [Gordionus sp. m RMFG-2023]
MASKFIVKDDVLYRKIKNKETLVIMEEEEKQRVISIIHQGSDISLESKAIGAHLGINKTQLKLSERCQKANVRFTKISSTLHPIDVPPFPWAQIGIDLCSLPTSEEIQINDQGREFVNEMTTRLHKMTGTEQRICSAYHPQANGLTERNNRTIQNLMLKVYESVVGLIAINNLPINLVTYESFKLLLDPIVQSLNMTLNKHIVNDKIKYAASEIRCLIMQQYNICLSQIYSITVDNGANMIKTVEMIAEEQLITHIDLSEDAFSEYLLQNSDNESSQEYNDSSQPNNDYNNIEITQENNSDISNIHDNDSSGESGIYMDPRFNYQNGIYPSESDKLLAREHLMSTWRQIQIFNKPKDNPALSGSPFIPVSCKKTRLDVYLERESANAPIYQNIEILDMKTKINALIYGQKLPSDQNILQYWQLCPIASSSSRSLLSSIC